MGIDDDDAHYKTQPVQNMQIQSRGEWMIKCKMGLIVGDPVHLWVATSAHCICVSRLIAIQSYYFNERLVNIDKIFDFIILRFMYVADASHQFKAIKFLAYMC